MRDGNVVDIFEYTPRAHIPPTEPATIIFLPKVCVEPTRRQLPDARGECPAVYFPPCDVEPKS